MQKIILDILEYGDYVGYSIEDMEMTINDAINILKENDFIVEVNGEFIYNTEGHDYAMDFLYNL